MQPEDALHTVRVPGPDLLIHGPDMGRQGPPPGKTARGKRARASRYGFHPGAVRRPPACSTDYYTHVVYLGPNPLTPAKRREIRVVMERTNAVLDRDAQASGGGGADLKVLCNESGTMRVTELTSDARTFDEVATAVRTSWFMNPQADYAVFVDRTDPSACGYGSLYSDDRPGPENLNNAYGGVAVIYRDCWTNDTAMHEIGHMQGAVQPSSPSATGSGHCGEEQDVMCYQDGGPLNQQLRFDCDWNVRYDCGFDDYFDARPEPNEYLATHWNLASPSNYYIKLR
jgi:hypothetical protein